MNGLRNAGKKKVSRMKPGHFCIQESESSKDVGYSEFFDFFEGKITREKSR